MYFYIIKFYHVNFFSNGNISGVLTGAKLDAVHCYEIGVYGMNSGSHYAQAVDWLELALNKITINGDLTIDKGIVTKAFLEAVNKHDEEHSRSSGMESYFFDQQIMPMMKNGIFSDRKTRRSIQYKQFAGRKGEGNALYNYWSVCSGNSYQTLEEKSELFCWLESKAHEQFFIGPIKMEFLARNPDVVQVYDVVSEGTMNQMKTETKWSMKSSFVVDRSAEKEAKTIEMDGRTSENTWINERNRKEYLQLVNTISHLTGLDAAAGTAAEEIQVASYTTSGHYAAHLDSDLPASHRSGKGERIATFMIYLSDVEVGGQTAFPQLGMSAMPVKGSAVFWYNVLRSEQLEVLSLHGACPVVIGEKYVANKWIRYNDQFLTHKCSKDHKERFQVAVNKKYLPVSKVLQASTRQKLKGWDKNQEVKTLELSKYSYRSPHGLKYLAETEEKIYKIMKLAYLEVNRNNSIDNEMDSMFVENNLCVQNYLSDYEDSSGKLLSENVGKSNYKRKKILPFISISGNPIAAYRMIWRVKNIIQKWVSGTNLVLGTSFQKTIAAVKRLYTKSEGPDADDLKDARSAIMSMQYVYELNALDIASGVIAGKSSGTKLNALQCYDIGMEGISDGAYTVGIDWLDAAIFLIDSKSDSSISPGKVELALKEAKDAHDKDHVISEGWEPVFFYHTFNSGKDHKSVKKVTRKKVQYNAFRLREEPNFAEINYNGICSGLPHQTPEEKAKLFCWYEHEIHPFWKLNPLKAEFHSLRPKLEIVQYYDLLPDKVISNLKDLAEPKFTKFIRMHGGTELGTNTPADDLEIRASVDSWLTETESDDVLYVSKLIERITGLTVANKSGDDLRISAYSPGANDDVHMDVYSGFPPGHYSAGRIASFMIFLSDVKLGGFNAFSQAGVRIIPTKGSGVFWYNLYSSGDPNHRTYHGMCPLIFGENWVANKWVSYENQDKHKCHTVKLTPDEILVNGKTKYL